MNPFYARMVAKKYVLIVNETLFGFIYMMPGSKGLSPHELAHRWVKDLRIYPDIFTFSLYRGGILPNGVAFFSCR